MRGRLAQLGFLFIKLAHDDRIEAGFTQGVLTVKLPKKTVLSSSVGFLPRRYSNSLCCWSVKAVRLRFIAEAAAA
jgi:hypothetical protein